MSKKSRNFAWSLVKVKMLELVSSIKSYVESHVKTIQWKVLFITFFHVLVWGVGLFCTTFFTAVSNKSLLSIFGGDIIKDVIAPSCIVLALFLWEEADEVEGNNLPLHEMKKQLKLNFIILGIVLILFAFVGMSTGEVQVRYLISVWVGISAIKFISKYYSKVQIEIKRV